MFVARCLDKILCLFFYSTDNCFNSFLCVSRQAMGRDEMTYEYLERCRWMTEQMGGTTGNLLAMPYGSVF